MNIRHPLATAVVVALASATTAASTDAAVTSDPSDYVLRRGEAPDSSALVGLTKTLKKSGVQALLNAKGNRKLSHRGGCRKAAAVPPKADWYCFNPGDTKTKEWIPQGVSGVSDAQDDELWGSAKPLLVSWYDADDRKPHKSVRVTFVNPANNTYRHVLLVWPYAQRGTGAPTYEPVGTHGTDKGIHAGGIAWYGNRLYVADTNRGVRVFDMRVILDLGASRNGTTTGADKVGLHGKTYYGKDGRLGMWPLQSTGAEPGDPLTDGNGRVVPRFVNGLPDSNIQGAAGANGNWWFTHNVKPENGARPGQLILARWPSGGGWVVNPDRQTISYGPEDLYCWRGRHQVWTVAEHAGRRALYGLPNDQCA
jgi:hypothetical protein